MQIHRKRNSRLNSPLQRNSKPPLCLQHINIYIQRKYTEIIAINGIRLVSKYERQYEKGRSHRSKKLQSTMVVYITVTIYFLMFFISCYFWISDFSFHFLQTFPATPIKRSKAYFVFLISVFAIFNSDHLKYVLEILT